MQKGLLGILVSLIVFAALAGALYYIWLNYSKVPNEETKKTALSIVRYPKASVWDVRDSKNLCLFATDGCDQPVKIMIETPDEWASLYNYYTTYMKTHGWSSNTTIVTSIPSTVVFARGKCQAVMANHNELKYSFTVVCKK